MPRNTRTGRAFNQMVLPALDQGGYKCDTQGHSGQRLGPGRHFVDAAAQKDDQNFLISLKWQQVPGTAEQKVPFDVICLIEALDAANFEKTFTVLGRESWTLRDFHAAGGLTKYLINSDNVEVVRLQAFVGRANQGEL